MTSTDGLSAPLRAHEAVAYLRTHGHPCMTVQALRAHLKRSRKRVDAGEAGDHLFPEPDREIVKVVQAWSPELLDTWKPLGRGNRTATRKEN